MLSKNELYKEDKENWNFDYLKRFEPQPTIHDKINRETSLIQGEIEVCKFIIFQGLQNG